MSVQVGVRTLEAREIQTLSLDTEKLSLSQLQTEDVLSSDAAQEGIEKSHDFRSSPAITCPSKHSSVLTTNNYTRMISSCAAKPERQCTTVSTETASA